MSPGKVFFVWLSYCNYRIVERAFFVLLVPHTKLSPVDVFSWREIGDRFDGVTDSVSNLYVYVFPPAIEIHCVPYQIYLLQHFKLIRGFCRHQFAQNVGYLPLPFQILRERFAKVFEIGRAHV